MKKLFLLTCGLCLMLFAQAQTTVTTTAGNLRADLITAVGGESNLGTITQLKINGTLNAQDFPDLGSGSGGTRINKAALISVDLSGVTAIENNEIPYQAFYQYTGLQNIILPAGSVIPTIGEQAFNGCTSLLDIDIPEGVTTIENHAFSDDNKVTTLRLPSTLRTIGDGTFNQFNALEQLTLPEGLTHIGSNAFYALNNPKMTQITIPASVEYIGAQAFALALYNERVTFAPRNGKPIEISGDRVFRSSGILSETGMSVFEFPDNTTISFNATGDGILSGFFSSCNKLKEVRNLPAGLTEFRFSIPTFGTFSGTAIEELVIPETVTVIGQAAFSSATKLKSLVLPDGVITIGNSAFANTTALTSIKLGNSVQSIGTSAFNNAAALETLELPATVTAIGESAFQNMAGLKALIVNNAEPIIFSTQKNVFTGINKETCILYVPASAVQDYKDFDYWNTFVNIRAIGSDADGQTIDNFSDITATVGSVVELNATASSGLSVTYEIADESIATIVGNTLTILKEGTTTITAKQPGDNVNYGPVEKTITLSVISLAWLEAPAIMVTGNAARVVGPAEAVARFTRFYINDEEVEQTDNATDLTNKTGELSLKATTADGAEVIRLKVNK